MARLVCNLEVVALSVATRTRVVQAANHEVALARFSTTASCRWTRRRDIVAGQRAGCAVHLVLIGVTTVPPAGLARSADLTGVLARSPG